MCYSEVVSNTCCLPTSMHTPILVSRLFPLSRMWSGTSIEKPFFPGPRSQARAELGFEPRLVQLQAYWLKTRSTDLGRKWTSPLELICRSSHSSTVGQWYLSSYHFGQMFRPSLNVYPLISVPIPLLRLGLMCPAPGEESEALTTHENSGVFAWAPGSHVS